MREPTQLSCQQAWEKLRAEFIEQVAAIDKMTPWSTVEPDWWCEMMDAEKAVREGSKS